MTQPSKPRRTSLSLQALESREVPATATLSGSTLLVEGTSGSDYIVVRQSGSTISVDGTSIKSGSSYVSSLAASRVRMVYVRGYAGNDTINVSTLNIPTMIWGGAGNDRIYGGNQSDYIYGDQGNDTIYGYGGNDRLTGGDGNDFIYGGAGNDWVSGDTGNDYLYGEAGNDTISGGEGRDFLSGGSGIDDLNGHGFGMGRADSTTNFDTYQDEFDYSRPFGTATSGNAPAFIKGEVDDPGLLAALGSVTVADLKANIKVLGSGLYDVYLPGDRRTVRVYFNGTWNDNDPTPTAGTTSNFWALLLFRARAQSYGISVSSFMSDADWDNQNKRTAYRLYSPSDALRQLTGRSVRSNYVNRLDFNTVSRLLNGNTSMVVMSAYAVTSTTNSSGIITGSAYVVKKAYADAWGRKWVELYNPRGNDTTNGRITDNAPGSVRSNDGNITISWDTFVSSSNFNAVYYA
jgi:hypothetical protein